MFLFSLGREVTRICVVVVFVGQLGSLLLSVGVLSALASPFFYKFVIESWIGSAKPIHDLAHCSHPKLPSFMCRRLYVMAHFTATPRAPASTPGAFDIRQFISFQHFKSCCAQRGPKRDLQHPIVREGAEHSSHPLSGEARFHVHST